MASSLNSSSSSMDRFPVEEECEEEKENSLLWTGEGQKEDGVGVTVEAGTEVNLCGEVGREEEDIAREEMEEAEENSLHLSLLSGGR